MRISLIVALDRNGLIGCQNRLPWHLPADLKHFKEVTMGKPVIMGRRTCESIGKPLPGRRNYVLTQNPAFHPDGFEVFMSLDKLLESIQPVEESVVIGGSGIYKLFWPLITRAYVTLIDSEFQGDTWFPFWPFSAEWDLKTADKRSPDEKNAEPITFMFFEKLEKN